MYKARKICKVSLALSLLVLVFTTNAQAAPFPRLGRYGTQVMKAFCATIGGYSISEDRSYAAKRKRAYQKNIADRIQLLEREISERKEYYSEVNYYATLAGAAIDCLIVGTTSISVPIAAPLCYAIFGATVEPRKELVEVLRKESERADQFSEAEIENIPLFVLSRKYSLDNVPGYFPLSKLRAETLASFFEEKDRQEVISSLQASYARKKQDREAFFKQYASSKYSYTISWNFLWKRSEYTLDIRTFFNDETIKNHFIALKYNGRDFLTEHIGDYFVSTDCDNEYIYQCPRLAFWNTARQECVSTHSLGDESYISDLEPYNDRYCFVASRDGSVGLFDLEEKRIKYRLYATGSDVVQVIKINDTTLVIRSGYGELTIWNLLVT